MIQPPTGHLGEAPSDPGIRTIPFDYSFRFDLEGTADVKHQQKITISVEAAFVAESLGYGVVPQGNPVRFGPTPAEIELAMKKVVTAPRVGGSSAGGAPPPATFGTLTLGSLFLALDRLARTRAGVSAESLMHGVRLNPEAASAAIAAYDPKKELREFPEATVRELFELVEEPPDQVPFLYAFFDEGSGREFQSEPILSTAGLGIANGDRPFRRFARPIRFQPRAQIRMEVTELSRIRGTLHLVLHGYKILGGDASPKGRIRRATRARNRHR